VPLQVHGEVFLFQMEGKAHKTMKYKKPRGTNDLFGDEMRLWQYVERTLSKLLDSYGYSEIRTPIFEETDLFIRTVGEGTDIVSKEMYTFNDKKGRSLTLRPENTAPVVRAFLENGLHRQAGISRFYYMGPMFRYDRPQAGRYRQFHQIGAETLGGSNPAIDAEIIEISIRIHEVLGLSDLEVMLNSVGCEKCRPPYMRILREKLQGLKDRLCEDCKDRAEVSPLRVFDCKKCTEVKKELPLLSDHLCEECEEHFSKLKNILNDIEVEYVLDPFLVRGLDYYTKTAFEIVHPVLGAQNALCGGGRYDRLAEECGGQSIPAVGFSAGMERLLEVVPEETKKGVGKKGGDVYISVIDSAVSGKALGLADELRRAGLKTEVDLSERSLKKQLRSASDSGAFHTILLGPEEIKESEATIKNMESGAQNTVAFDEIVEFIKSERGKFVE
jgi:histidyl-tRNA synthetase